MRRLPLALIGVVDIAVAVAMLFLLPGGPLRTLNLRIALAVVIWLPLLVGTIIAVVLSVADWKPHRNERVDSEAQRGG